MRVLNIILYTLLICCSCLASAKDYDFFAEDHDGTESMFDAAYPQIKTDYSILHNLFFQDDRCVFITIPLTKPINLIKRC